MALTRPMPHATVCHSDVSSTDSTAGSSNAGTIIATNVGRVLPPAAVIVPIAATSLAASLATIPGVEVTARILTWQQDVTQPPQSLRSAHELAELASSLSTKPETNVNTRILNWQRDVAMHQRSLGKSLQELYTTLTKCNLSCYDLLNTLLPKLVNQITDEQMSAIDHTINRLEISLPKNMRDKLQGADKITTAKLYAYMISSISTVNLSITYIRRILSLAEKLNDIAYEIEHYTTIRPTVALTNKQKLIFQELTDRLENLARFILFTAAAITTLKTASRPLQRIVKARDLAQRCSATIPYQQHVGANVV